jgi:hypothetical protein
MLVDVGMDRVKEGGVKELATEEVGGEDIRVTVGGGEGDGRGESDREGEDE